MPKCQRFPKRSFHFSKNVFFPEKCPGRLTAEELQKLEEKLPALQDVAAQAARAIPQPGKPVDPDVLEDLQVATFLQER